MKIIMRSAHHKMTPYCNRRFTDEECAEMANLRSSGMKWKDVGARFGISDKEAQRYVQRHHEWEGAKPLTVPDVTKWDFSQENVA